MARVKEDSQSVTTLVLSTKRKFHQNVAHFLRNWVAGAGTKPEPGLGEKSLRKRDFVRIGCGAGFAGDRPNAARHLLLEVPDMHYLVLECLAERTLSTRYDAMVAGGKGYDPRISDWMRVLLPDAVRLRVRLITNMGAVDPLGAQEEVVELAAELGLSITVAVAYEVLDVGTVGSHPSGSKRGVGHICQGFKSLEFI